MLIDTLNKLALLLEWMVFMFFVLNRQKIYTYLISVVTVVLLFCVASSTNNNSSGNTVQTASTTQTLLPIYNVQTEEKKIAFTMNCAW